MASGWIASLPDPNVREHSCSVLLNFEAPIRMQLPHDVTTFCNIPMYSPTSGGMGKCASIAYKRLASLLPTEQEQSYGSTIAWVRCCPLLRSSIMCLRGARSSHGRAFRSSVIDLAVAEAKIPSISSCLTH